MMPKIKVLVKRDGKLVKLTECLYCGQSPLLKGRRKFCSDECQHNHFIEKIAPLWWPNAVTLAMDRAQGKCENCGAISDLEVHHKEPLGGEVRHNNPKNRLDNLVVLCHGCHRNVHWRGVKRAKFIIPKEQLSLGLEVMASATHKSSQQTR